MEWKTLKAALDLAVEHGQHRIKILFSGGEPLLEFDLIQKAVAYVERKLPQNKQVLFGLVTNGTLLTEETVAYLARHPIDIQISFDGVSAAQDVRAEGTFAILDSLLDRLQRQHPELYQSNIKISTTVIPETVQYIADSFRYFLTKDVRRVAIAPSIADTSCWKPDWIGQLESQLAGVCEMSLTHFDRTGEVPLLLFRPSGKEGSLAESRFLATTQDAGVRRLRGRSRTNHTKEAGRAGARNAAASRGEQSRIQSQYICAAGRGAMLAVDVGGQVYPCITLATSCQTIASPVLQKSIEAMWLGSLTGQQFWERYHRLPEAASRLPMFAPKESRYSSYRACRDCAYFTLCVVCPVSMGYLQGNENCERVPDFTCAFNFTVLKYRERFLEQAQPRGQDGPAL